MFVEIVDRFFTRSVSLYGARGHLLDGAVLLLDQRTGKGDRCRGADSARIKLDPAPLGARPAASGAVDDEGALEPGDAGEPGQHHAPGQGGGTGPRLGQAAQACAGGLDTLCNVQQVAGAVIVLLSHHACLWFQF